MTTQQFHDRGRTDVDWDRQSSCGEISIGLNRAGGIVVRSIFSGCVVRGIAGARGNEKDDG
jgi:hypothetical protein